MKKIKRNINSNLMQFIIMSKIKKEEPKDNLFIPRDLFTHANNSMGDFR